MKDLCKKLHKKLHNSKGETLGEVLVSILLCTLSVALLFSGIMVAARINEQAESSDGGFFYALNAAEEKSGTPFQENKKIKVVETGGTAGVMVEFTVNYYGDETIHSYKLAPKTPIPGSEGGGVTP